MSVAESLGEWAAGLSWKDVPEDRQAHLRMIVLDTLGCMLSGSAHESVGRLARLCVERRPSDRSASAAGPVARLTLGDATLVNGLATGIDVFDSGNILSRGHVAGYVMPAVLTSAEAVGGSFEDFLIAFLAGYEVAARIGAACTLRQEVFTSGTWGVVGAAAGIARARRMDRSALTEVIELGANITLASSRGAVTSGASVRDLYSALPSQMGAQVVELTEAGFRGAREAVETTFGQILSGRFDSETCVAGLGELWLLDRNYFKRYPGCRNFQGAVDCVLEALPGLERPFDPARDRMTVGLDPIGYSDNRGIHTENQLAAMESAPVGIAMTVLHGRLAPDLYKDQAYLEEDVLALARSLAFEEAKRQTPDQRPGWVRIEQEGLASVERSTTHVSGSAEKPISVEELKEKFFRNAASVLGEAERTKVADQVLSGPLHWPLGDCLAGWLGCDPMRAARRVPA